MFALHNIIEIYMWYTSSNFHLLKYAVEYKNRNKIENIRNTVNFNTREKMLVGGVANILFAHSGSAPISNDVFSLSKILHDSTVYFPIPPNMSLSFYFTTTDSFIFLYDPHFTPLQQ